MVGSRPRPYPSDSLQRYIVPEEFSGPISQKIRGSRYTEPKGGELVSIEFDDTAKNELICWCEAHSANSANGITPQKLIHAFCRFAIEAENLRKR